MKIGYKIGYARVSTDAQETHLQLDALQRAKCRRIYQEKVSGATADRPALMRLLDHARQRGRVGGRPKALTADDLKKARALLRSGEYTKVEVAKELKVSRHTLWRALAQGATS